MLAGSTLCQVGLAFADLYGANLIGAKLYGANLIGAKLHGADLSSAELHGAYLSGAELYGADLSSAELHGANLVSAKLHGANLAFADLYGADLSGAELYGANLWGAKLHGANLWGTQLHGASSHPDFHESLTEAVINKRIGKESDLSGATFAGGLSRNDVASIGQGLPDEDAKRLRAELAEHIEKPVSHELPDTSGARIGAYTEEDAAQWIAEYKTAVSGGG